ncbi:TonB-dependent receptor [Flavobacterium sp.]|uniref:TonB-dependent receptor n=1 Tax=Flavobacterium sp. TaxID=239 RepID=UPI0026026BF2|nr:TonB-dependent receptor [Flavobacterium sp.]
MRNFLSVFFLLVGTVAFAQKGTIAGKITDKDVNNEPMSFANVVLKGTTIGTATDIDGNFELAVEPGNYTVEISFVGYETILVPVTVVANQTVTINRAMSTGSVKLEDVVLVQQVNKQKENALLLEQKNAVEIKQSIGAQELARKGVSDVATAVTKTTGITKQEGSGTIFVRGLGDRYNATTLNGLPLPSSDPERKNISLEIFGTDIVEFISIDKVYNSRIYGDFAGGNVDIVSKEHKGAGFLKFDIGGDVNSNAINNEDFRVQNGYNKSGFTNKSRPGGTLNNYNFSSLSNEQPTAIANSFALTGGKSFNLGNTGKLSLFGTISYDNDFAAKADGVARGGVNGAGVVFRNFPKFSEVTYSTNTTAMGNIGYKINAKNKINFNSLFINASSLSTQEYSGLIIDIADNGNGFLRRYKYDQNKLFVNQLLGEHKFTERIKLNWGGSFSTINGNQPDRVQNIFRQEANGFLLSNVSSADNHRYFQELTENEIAFNAAIDYKIGKTEEGEYKGKITVGANARQKKREFEAVQYNLDINNNFVETVVNPNNLDSFFNQANLNAGVFSLSTFRGNAQVPTALDPQFYNGDLNILAGFANAEYQFGKLTGVFGLRLETIEQLVEWNTSVDPAGGDNTLDKVAFLPSITLKYELNEKQNLRFGFSKTYTLPQFKERAFFVYEDAIEAKFGNPDLYESDEYNFDLKWELFPKADELISITGFGKLIQNPINEISVLSSTNDVSYANTGDQAYVAGAELELRKNIFSIGETNARKLSAGFNASYLYSQQDLDEDKVRRENRTVNLQADFTDDSSKLTGASDLLMNADITFSTDWNDKQGSFMTTLAYTYFSDRIYSLGTVQRGNQVDKSFGVLDWVTRTKLTKNFGINFIARNLLDPKIERVQENNSGDITVLSYRKGMNFSLGMSYQF